VNDGPIGGDTKPSARILVIEDEPDMLLGIEHNLRYEGYEVATASTGTDGLASWRRIRPDLVLLDVMLPEMDGFEVLRAIRREDAEVPVILLTAKGLEADKVHGLTLGADDYITKPFSIRELLARLQAVLRRTRTEEGPARVHSFGDVEVDFIRRECRKRGKEVPLSYKEFELLRLLIENRGETITRERLLEEVWGKDAADAPTSRTVDTHIANLRRKVEGSGERGRHIRTVHKVGYKFVDDPEEG
jgi:two-component system, OmpR family, alkaline phosphatase synthesis response regulator PhoP